MSEECRQKYKEMSSELLSHLDSFEKVFIKFVEEFVGQTKGKDYDEYSSLEKDAHDIMFHLDDIHKHYERLKQLDWWFFNDPNK